MSHTIRRTAVVALATVAMSTTALAGGYSKKADIVDTAVSAGTSNTLDGPGPFSVFAPTDEAFANTESGVEPVRFTVNYSRRGAPCGRSHPGSSAWGGR